MGKVSNQSIRNSIFSYIGLGLATLNNVILVPRAFSIHPEAEWGLVQYLTSLIIIITPLASLGIPNALIRYMPFYRDDKKHEFAYLALLGSAIAMGLAIIGTGIYLIGPARETEDPLIRNHLFLLIPMLVGSTLFEIGSGYSRSLFNSTLPVFLKETFIRICNSVILLLYWQELIDFKIFIFGYAAIYIIKAIVISIFLYSSGELRFQKLSNTFSRKTIVEIGKFALIVFLGGETASLIQRLDVILIEKFLDLQQIAYYSIPFYIGMLIRTPGKSIAAISTSVIADYWKNHRLSKILEIYQQTAQNQMVLGLFIFLGIWLNIDFLLWILGDKFGSSEAKMVILFIGLGQLIETSTGANGQIIVNSKLFRYDLYFKLLLVAITLGLDLWLIPWMGIIGAALAAGIASLIYNIMKMGFLYHRLKMQPFTTRTLYVLGISLIVFAIVSLIPLPENIVLRLAIRSLIISAFFLVGILYFDIAPDLRKVIKKVFLI